MNFTEIRIATFSFASLLTAAALSLSPASLAQNAPQGQPSRAVRLSFVDGKVQLNQGGQPLADQAVINAPLFEGTQITTGDDGKAEIQFEDGSVARLSPDSALTLKTLNGDESEMVLDRGLGYFELQSAGQAGQLRVDFAGSQVTASGFTVLRVNMDNPPGAMAVFSGNAHVDRANGATLDLHGGQSAEFNGADPNNPDIAEAIQPDSWDAWNSDRDQALNTEASSQSAATGELAGGNTSNPAWSDLDANGNWYNVPDQGYVWSPYDAANPGFDPYGNGSWIGTPGYGYVWASGYSWGYMPYQCGAWNFYGGFGWGWAPGMGGCNPWWGSGFYGGPMFGAVPIGYGPIHRPIWGRYPHPGRIIPMNRPPFRTAANLPARDRSAPVTIAGHTVEPLRPVTTRPAMVRPSEGPGVRGYVQARGVTPVAQPSPRTTYVPARSGYTVAPVNGFSRTPTYTAPRSASAPAPRSYSPPPSHSSGGGGGSYSGGGGGGHSSGGGGGGHSSGGGGGGHSSGGGGGGGHR